MTDAERPFWCNCCGTNHRNPTAAAIEQATAT